MTRLKLWRAANQALHDALEADERVVVLGQDVARPGGPYGLTRGLVQRFGEERVRDAPIAEGALLACGVGAAMAGLRPVVEIMFLDFVTLAMDQLVNQAAKFRFFNPGGALPLVVHTLYGGRASMGAQHSQALEAWLCHVPGLKVAFPSAPQDAYDVLRDAIDDPGPVVVIEPIALLRAEGEVDLLRPRTPTKGAGRLVRSGGSATVVSWGPAVGICEDAIASLGADVDLVDLRWLQPWDRDLVLSSFRRTGRLLVVHDAVEEGGYGAEIVATITKEGFWSMDAPPMRVGAPARPIPVRSADWRDVLPSVERVADALARLLAA